MFCIPEHTYVCKDTGSTSTGMKGYAIGSEDINAWGEHGSSSRNLEGTARGAVLEGNKCSLQEIASRRDSNGTMLFLGYLQNKSRIGSSF